LSSFTAHISNSALASTDCPFRRTRGRDPNGSSCPGRAAGGSYRRSVGHRLFANLPRHSGCFVAVVRNRQNAKLGLALTHVPASYRSALRASAFLTWTTRKVLAMADFISKPTISVHGRCRIAQRSRRRTSRSFREKAVGHGIGAKGRSACRSIQIGQPLPRPLFQWNSFPPSNRTATALGEPTVRRWCDAPTVRRPDACRWCAAGHDPTQGSRLRLPVTRHSLAARVAISAFRVQKLSVEADSRAHQRGRRSQAQLASELLDAVWNSSSSDPAGAQAKFGRIALQRAALITGDERSA
jgi:hypothetical protein